MDRFLISNAYKRSRSNSDEVMLVSKKPRTCSKQGIVTAAIRIAEFWKKLFYADGGKLFYRPCNLVVDHYRKDIVAKHLKSEVIALLSRHTGHMNEQLLWTWFERKSMIT